MTIKREDVADVLREKLLKGETKFSYIKSCGAVRSAIGTLDLGIIPEADTQFKNDNTDKEPSKTIVTYYDLEKMGWRCCKADSVLTIDGEEVVYE